MAKLKEAQIYGIISLALVLTAAVIVENLEKSYYCASEDNVKECLRLSSSGITCYYLAADDLTRGDRCTGGTWEPLDIHLGTKSDTQDPVGNYIKVRANEKEWTCQADNGFVNPYTRCISGTHEGYLGEFI